MHASVERDAIHRVDERRAAFSSLGLELHVRAGVRAGRRIDAHAATERSAVLDTDFRHRAHIGFEISRFVPLRDELVGGAARR